MAAQHLAALIRELHPGVSVRQLELDAGMPLNSIAYFLKPSTVVKRIPPVETCDNIATALKCDTVEVVRAFAADVDLPWNDPPLSQEDRELLRMIQRLSSRDRKTVRFMVQSMMQADETNG